MSNSKISFVTISDDRFGRKDGKYSETQDLALGILKSNSHLDISQYFFWKFDDIVKTGFYSENFQMLSNPDPSINGRCYKPFVILDALKSIKDGDFLIYNDVSPEHWKNISLDSREFSTSVIMDLCEANGGILSSEAFWIVDNEFAPHTHENFTTDRCMFRMGMEGYKHSIQHASGMMCFRKSNFTMGFVSEWLRWNLIDECASLSSLDGSESYYSPHNKFGHRHDQSISGLLVNGTVGKILKNPGGYNFSAFCRKKLSYEFIETNQGPSEYIYRSVLKEGKWITVKELRNPKVTRGSSYPLNL